MIEATSRIGMAATEALDLFIAAVEQIPQENWDRPSNLADWTVRELVGHATGSATKVVTLVEGGQLWNGPSEPADWICADPAARLRELADRLRDALPHAELDAPRPSPGGEVPLHRALAFPVSDLAMHSWDVHRSQGRLVELPDALLAFCRALVESIPEEVLRQPGKFGPAQPAPADASPTTLLMTGLGRTAG
ncbi:TIGR03086 family metal-binding protein [Sciscionella sediminilitoris]|uniref:TIGR03086 family metal-binding protein n=1 Tax=Sciscionella sediminilitoris TaxID=1445613 RepID=UPI0004DEE2BE|nr:TIGR03086 family metal-binding protein [Sciscionella sp. SE31]